MIAGQSPKMVAYCGTVRRGRAWQVGHVHPHNPPHAPCQPCLHGLTRRVEVETIDHDAQVRRFEPGIAKNLVEISQPEQERFAPSAPLRAEATPITSRPSRTPALSSTRAIAPSRTT